MVGKATGKFEPAFERSPESFRFECFVENEGLSGGRLSELNSQDDKVTFGNADHMESVFANLPVALSQFSGAANYDAVNLKRMLFESFESAHWQCFMPYE